MANARQLGLYDVIEDQAVSEDILRALSTKIGLKPTTINLRHLEVLIAGLKDGRPKSMSRTKNKWTKTIIPPYINPLGITFKMVSVVNLMRRHGYLEQFDGFKDEYGKGFNSRIMATPRLLTLTKGVVTVKHPDAPLLILKDSDKKVIPFRETSRIRTIKAPLRRYNRLLNETHIELGKSTLEPSQKHIYRVFNNSRWCFGGRFYGGVWQRYGSDLRRSIRINGESTVELDYSSQHAHMAYAIKKIPIPEGDLYDLPGISNRKYGKIAFLMMFNAATRAETIRAYYKHKKIKNDPYRAPAIDVIDKLIDKHHPAIQRLFFTGIGLKFQYRDSKISATILDALTDDSVPCLSVHDSFIVQKRYKDRLTEVMVEAYRQEMGSDSKVPKIDLK